MTTSANLVLAPNSWRGLVVWKALAQKLSQMWLVAKPEDIHIQLKTILVLHLVQGGAGKFKTILHIRIVHGISAVWLYPLWC